MPRTITTIKYIHDVEYLVLPNIFGFLSIV